MEFGAHWADNLDSHYNCEEKNWIISHTWKPSQISLRKENWHLYLSHRLDRDIDIDIDINN